MTKCQQYGPIMNRKRLNKAQRFALYYIFNII
jgi:hypothetical protein